MGVLIESSDDFDLFFIDFYVLMINFFFGKNFVMVVEVVNDSDLIFGEMLGESFEEIFGDIFEVIFGEVFDFVDGDV